MFEFLTSTKVREVLNDYRNYRWFFTSNNTLVVGGKSDDQNELAIKFFSKPSYKVFHTSQPGSPFMIIQSDNPSKNDIKEAATFCGCFSQAWKKNLKKIDIDMFQGNEIYKIPSMKTGTFGVKGEKEVIKIKPELVLVIQKGKLRAVPNSGKEQKLAIIKPGTLTKEQAAEKISSIIKEKFDFPISKDEIMQAIPADNLYVK